MRFIRSLTLKELCFKTVIENLGLYIYNKDYHIPERHISFLLRLYSKECFCQYTSLHRKTEECLLWFLSAPNKIVYLPNVTKNIMKRLQTVGPAITTLTLRESFVTENVLNSVICCVPHLSCLDLSDTNCSDKTLLCIQKMCPELVTLNVQNCIDITDDGMLNLCGNNLSLKNLNILNTSVELTGLHDVLKNMPSLQCLTYDNMADSFYQIHKSDVHFCIQNNIKYNLTELIYEDDMYAENPRRVIWTWTVLCPNVKKVHILFPVRHDVLEMCSRFSQLEEFRLKAKCEFYEFDYYYDNFIDVADDFDMADPLVPILSIANNMVDPLVPILSIANNLTTLILSHVKIPSVTLIECFKNVKILCLKDVSFTDFNEDHIKSKSTNLNSLTIENLHLSLTDATYKFIALLISLSKNVVELVIRSMNYLPDELIDIILDSMRKLTFIDFSFIRTRLPASFNKFYEIPTLQQVNLDGCLAPYEGTVHISQYSCTLSWRIMVDICEDDDDDDEDEDELECDISEL